MKKIIFTLALLLSCLAVNAQQPPVKIKIVKGGVPNPRTPTDFTLEAEHTSEELIFSITNYTGDVEVFILNDQNVCVYDDTMNVVGSDSLDVDLTSYPTGTYVLYIRLDNNDLYEGTFDL